MKRTDYFRLAKWLLQRESNRLLRGFEAGLCMDSVLPGCNPLTSLRGIRGRQGLHGHNTEITGKRICRLVISLTKAKKAGACAAFGSGRRCTILPTHLPIRTMPVLQVHFRIISPMKPLCTAPLSPIWQTVATRGHGRIFRISAPFCRYAPVVCPCPKKRTDRLPFYHPDVQYGV